MAHKVEEVANFFLRVAHSEACDITHLKLQKLAYFAQGHALSLLDTELINDECESWTYGPVFPALYHRLKKYGPGEIEKEIEDNRGLEVFEPKLRDVEQRLLRSIWRKYGSLSALTLSTMTHVDDGPWQQTRLENPGELRATIDKKKIKEYFVRLKNQDYEKECPPVTETSNRSSTQI